MTDVPFLTDFRRAITLTDTTRTARSFGISRRIAITSTAS